MSSKQDNHEVDPSLNWSMLDTPQPVQETRQSTQARDLTPFNQGHGITADTPEESQAANSTLNSVEEQALDPIELTKAHDISELQEGHSKDASPETSSRKNKTLFAAGAATGVAAIGLVLALLTGDSESRHDDSSNGLAHNKIEASTEVHQNSATTEEMPNESTGGHSSSEEAQEIINNEYVKPVLMTGNNLNELLGQYQHNIECLMNSSTIENQLECQRYLTGDGTGELSSNLVSYIYELRDYRENVDSDYFPYIQDIEVVDSMFSPEENFPSTQWGVAAIVYIRYSDEYSEQLNLEFIRGELQTTTSSADELATSTESVRTWLLTSRRQSQDVSEDRFVG